MNPYPSCMMSRTPSLSIMLSNSNSGSLYLFLRSLSKLLFFLSWWLFFWCCCGCWLVLLVLLPCALGALFCLLSFFCGCPFGSSFLSLVSVSGPFSAISVFGLLGSAVFGLGVLSRL